MKIQCKPNRERLRQLNSVNERHKSVHWKMCLPFVVNPRGILVHRVRWATTHFWKGEVDHDSVMYWCGNSVSSVMEFVEVPPEDRLLCARCEAIAVAAGEKPADELAGRHVHVGETRAKRLCCTNEDN